MVAILETVAEFCPFITIEAYDPVSVWFVVTILITKKEQTPSII